MSHDDLISRLEALEAKVARSDAQLRAQAELIRAINDYGSIPPDIDINEVRLVRSMPIWLRRQVAFLCEWKGLKVFLWTHRGAVGWLLLQGAISLSDDLSLIAEMPLKESSPTAIVREAMNQKEGEEHHIRTAGASPRQMDYALLGVPDFSSLKSIPGKPGRSLWYAVNLDFPGRERWPGNCRGVEALTSPYFVNSASLMGEETAKGFQIAKSGPAILCLRDLHTSELHHFTTHIIIDSRFGINTFFLSWTDMMVGLRPENVLGTETKLLGPVILMRRGADDVAITAFPIGMLSDPRVIAPLIDVANSSIVSIQMSEPSVSSVNSDKDSNIS